MIACIVADLLETVAFCKVGVLVAAAYLAARIMVEACSGRKLRGWMLAKEGLLVFYGIMVLEIAFFSREPGSRDTVDFQLFHTWGRTEQEHAWVIENVMMFLPFGFLIPACVKWCRRLSVTAGLALVCSAGLELAQYLTQRGHCQVDDVVMNVVGGGIGWMVWRWSGMNKTGA